jgi:hypothetical protein
MPPLYQITNFVKALDAITNFGYDSSCPAKHAKAKSSRMMQGESEGML